MERYPGVRLTGEVLATFALTFGPMALALTQVVIGA